MPRLARIKIEEGGAYYHLCARTGGHKGEYPLDSKLCRRTLIDLIERFSRVYCCTIFGFCVMGNHYHLIIWFDERRTLSKKGLWKRAALLYPEQILKGWLKSNWERFNDRIFDVSELMRNVQAAFARFFNRTFGRRGRFWADRFKSTLLEDEKQVMDCLLYVDLNPVRAGLVERPEEYEGSSVYYREIGKDKWMLPLGELTGYKQHKAALRDYKARLYYRGNVPTKRGQADIPDRIVSEEEARGFKERGVFRKRLRHFADGVVLGSEAFVRKEIERLRDQGIYLRRKNPIPQLGGMQTSLREQRETAVAF
jgi:putative transposase